MLSQLDAIVPDSGEITAGIRRGRNRDWNPAAIARRIPVAIVSEIWRDHGRIPAASRPNARLPGQQWGRSVGDGARGQLRGCRSAAGHEEARGWSRDTQLSCQIYPTMKIFTIVFSPQNSSIPISAYSTDLPPPLDRMVRPASQRDVATNRGDPGERCGRKKGQENDVGVTPSTGKGAAKRRLLRSRYLAVKNLINKREDIMGVDSDNFDSIVTEVESLHELDAKLLCSHGHGSSERCSCLCSSNNMDWKKWLLFIAQVFFMFFDVICAAV
ncbi:hypothetical protein ZIOFF_032000 [Zingiber officinale]|uniref:Uncharacterized protein n=1 Tax=Zingiber officinale TaxID=94328 RepID=A0A8J5GMY2_ZINOF|nr:hypothetical protein ZIOFF_032000 [Zingiber officinale]